MFGNKRRAPPDTPFDHSSDCRTPDAKPQWGFLPGSGGQWERVCSCRREVQTVVDNSKIDPNSNRAEPHWQAHQHSPSCEAAGISAVIRTEKREAGSGWRTTCSVCGTICIFWWNPEATDRNGRPISREGNISYRYELKHQLVKV